MSIPRESSLQSEESIKSLLEITTLQSGGRTVKKLPNGSFVYLEHDVPYILVYQRMKKDKRTVRLVKSAASYLILSTGDKEENISLLKTVLHLLSQKFRTFLIIQVYEGDLHSTDFEISCANPKLSSTLNALVEGLSKVEARFGSKLSVKLNQADSWYHSTRHPLQSSNLKALGGASISLIVPPAYRDGEGTEFPVYFRKFRTQFTKSVQESLFEFIRVQTTSEIASYHALGKREIHEKVITIDRQIAKIQNSYSFLLLVAPVNISELWRAYKSSKFSTIGRYHYRLLPVDPDYLKRKLYNLDIHDIDDPALAYLYDEKREELDHELTMLKERGSTNFFYSSIRMYGLVPKPVLAEARAILSAIAEQSIKASSKLISATSFAALADKEFDYFRSMAPDYSGKVHIRQDVNITMVERGELYLPANFTLTKTEAQALIQHEIGTHALTYYNGAQQPLQLMAGGLAGYDALQEGIAVLAEYLAGALSANRLRTLAGRVVAGDLLCNGADFNDMFHALCKTYGFSPFHAFDITSRMFQGSGFLKDVIYLKGILQLRDYLSRGGSLAPLLAGKFALKHLATISDLTQRSLLYPPKIIPRYLKENETSDRFKNFKNGMPIQHMV